MDEIRYFTEASLVELRESVPDRLDWYYSGSHGRKRGLSWPESRRARVERRTADLRLTATEKPGQDDPVNALRVHDHLRELSRHEASEERLWAYLCHVECADYVRSRWLARRPKKKEAAVREVRNHFFARGARALIRDNGISRLWWLGKIAREVDPERPEEFLKIVLYRQDVRSSLLERPFVSRNVEVLRMIYAVMKEHWKDEGDRALFDREVFRAWMRGVNRRGGVVLLDALSEPRLRRLLEEEAEAALEGAARKGR